MPQDIGPSLNSRRGISYQRDYPYSVERPRSRPWRRVALGIAELVFCAAIGTGFAWAVVQWASAPW